MYTTDTKTTLPSISETTQKTTIASSEQTNLETTTTVLYTTYTKSDHSHQNPTDIFSSSYTSLISTLETSLISTTTVISQAISISSTPFISDTTTNTLITLSDHSENVALPFSKTSSIENQTTEQTNDIAFYVLNTNLISYTSPIFFYS